MESRGVPEPNTWKEAELLPPSLALGPGAELIPPRVDEYGWMKRYYMTADNADQHDVGNRSLVLAHLQEENAHAEAVLAPSQMLQRRLWSEMLARVPRQESSVPQRQGRHWYYSVHQAGMQYRWYARRPISHPDKAPSEHDSMDLHQPEEVLLDEDQMAGPSGYFDMVGLTVSPDEQAMVFGVDRAGNEGYTLHVRNITTNSTVFEGSDDALFPEIFRLCAGDFAFLDDSRTVLFTTLTADTRRADKVWRLDPTTMCPDHCMPELLFHEPDEQFHLALWRSRSDALIYIRGGSAVTHYLFYLPADGSTFKGTPATVDMSTGRSWNQTTNADALVTLATKVHEQQYLVRDWYGSSKGGGTSSSFSAGRYLYAVVYTAEQRNGQLIVTALAPHALLSAPASIPDRQRSSSVSGGGQSGAGKDSTAENSNSSSGSSNSDSSSGGGRSGGGYWALLQAHNTEVEIVDLTVSSSHLAVLERKNGTLVATAYPLSKDGSPLDALPEGQQFAWDARSYSLSFADQGPFQSRLLRVEYSSLKHPLSTFDINMQTGNRVLKQQQEVVGFDGSLYQSQLLWASSTNGTQVPISMVYRSDRVKLDGSDPLLLEAYGAYGASFDPEFSGTRLSLLDRGFIHAIAHVRGGGERGRYWYQAGKLLTKNNTFDDLIACAEYLIKSKYTSNSQLAVWGRSAGGLTVGAAVNRRPDLFQAAILDVPFVDVVTTMSDPSQPLTVVEWEEWGNPTTDRAAYDNMLSYSPFDNIARQPYPHLLLTAGVNDQRVRFWEPAKFAAKVRELKTSNGSLVLLRTNMAAGHFAQSGVEDRLKETAFKFAFLLQMVAPCARLPSEQPQPAGCRGCFAAFVAATTTVALITLVVVLRPSSRFGRKWRRGLRRRMRPAGGDSGGDSEEDEDEELDGEGYDTRLYSVHMEDEEEAAEAAAVEEEQLRHQQRRLRQQQLEQEGLSLTSYEAVRETVRDRLLPINGPAGTPVAPLPAPPPKRRLSLGPGNGSSGIELSALNGAHGRLPAIAESP